MFRILAFAAFALVTCGHPAGGADGDALPPEPREGEWLEDTLDDDSLWFASSENLAFDPVARELVDYPQGRCWVRVIDGKPAWVMYYVPGEILGFEVDTHHFGAAGTEFSFAAGATWTSLAPVEADLEEIVAFEAKWLRLYRSAGELPQGTRFLRIDFPQTSEIDAARLTEVWLRCRFDDTTQSDATGPNSGIATVAVPLPPTPAGDGTEIEPFVVTTFIFRPQPLPAPKFPPVTVEATRPVVALETSSQLAPTDLFGDFVPVVEAPPPPPPEKPKSLLSRIVDFWRHRIGR